MKRRILAIATVVTLTALALGGCSALAGSNSSGSSGSAGSSGTSGTEAGPAIVAPGAGSADSASGGGAAGSVGSAATLPSTQVITTGSIALIADDPIAAADKAVSTVEAAGGHVDNRSESLGNTGGPGIIMPLGANDPAGTTQGTSSSGTSSSSTAGARADLTLRIPNAQVTSTVDALKKLGTVDSVTLTSTDVTTQVADVNARITALQTSVDRLLDLMTKATTTADLIALESALSQRQAELDGLKAQSSALADQVQYASVTLTITSHSVLATGAPNDFWGGLAAGWSSLVAGAAGGLVVLGIALPWLLAIALVAAIVLLVIRFARRSGSRKATN
ncbi:DUF4349 domain-containing protein [Subtercola sp. PAMC28395]|uniref:DUF4349 domain-containing protein n=1 Tax=Subtercola sp. PAMC28395 TaxID=2846775 RepID=UPI001C0D1875|nr:DUF4349 domain-containing protein [Subtercola sp. PAMC28395]QWT23823.1 DUF4349 domain-containing protein [Subtercola sp. PAMC28395]